MHNAVQYLQARTYNSHTHTSCQCGADSSSPQNCIYVGQNIFAFSASGT